MVRIITFTIAWFGFGIIAAEIINSFEWFEFRINVLYIAVPITCFFLVSEFILNYYKNRQTQSIEGEIKYKKVQKLYNLLLGFISLVVFVIIPLVWWGVIKQLAMIATEGVRKF